jgi:hypothetical protein
MALRPPRRFSALNERADLPALSAYELGPGHPTPGTPSLLRPPFGDNDQRAVPEY